MTDIQQSLLIHRRTMVYVDGFNLYYGLKDSHLKKFYWLDIQRLGRALLKPEHQLLHTKYFTARISGAAHGDSSLRAQGINAKRKRQSDYLEALGTRTEFTMYFGLYLNTTAQCLGCGRVWITPQEKMTDVNIATELLSDAFQDAYDAAFVISADSDLTPPIKTIRRLFPKKSVVVAFPPGRSSKELAKNANGVLHINQTMLIGSQFPKRVVKPDGYAIFCPAEWV